MTQLVVLQDFFEKGRTARLLASEVIDDAQYNVPELVRSGLAVTPFLGGMAPVLAAFRQMRDHSPLAEGDLVGLLVTAGFLNVETPLAFATTGVSNNTAALGVADVYVALAAGITITISSADITDGREFLFKDENGAASKASPITIATEGAQTIDGAATVLLTRPFDSVAMYARGGDLFITVQPEFLSIGFAEMNSNSTATVIASVDTYQALDASGLVSNAVSERFTLTDATAGVYRYDGDRSIVATISSIINAVKSGATQDYRFGLSVNGAIPVFATATYSPLEVKATKLHAAVVSFANLGNGDTIQIMIAGDGHSDNLTITDFQVQVRG